jgi:hypothetical protein
MRHSTSIYCNSIRSHELMIHSPTSDEIELKASLKNE